MNRRKFIVLVSSGVMAMGAATIYFDVFNTPLKAELFYLEDLTYIFSNEELISLGNLYLKKFENENDLNKIIKLLEIEKGIDSGLLEQKIQNDYKNDATIVLDGWIFSITEARQCAFLSLTQKKG